MGMTARLHPLLHAVINTLPPDPPWATEKRQAFLRMLETAFDVVYGPTGAAPNAVHPLTIVKGDPIGDTVTLPTLYHVARNKPLTDRWHIDAEGQARTPQGHEANLETVPQGTLFIDYRPEPDACNAATVIWADGTWVPRAINAKGIIFQAPKTAAA